MHTAAKLLPQEWTCERNEVSFKRGGYMGINNYLTGTPWHIEKFTRQENDPRRHRSRCIYYISESKHCSYRCGQCIGSAHCSHYKENTITPVTEVPKEIKNPTMEFSGVKDIPLSQVKIDSSKAKEPSEAKVHKLIEYFKQNGKLDKPIIVSIQGNMYLLEDKYLRYYVAKKLGLQYISAKIGTFQESKTEDMLRKVGTKVKHLKYGNGVVIAANAMYTTIRFDNMSEIKFDISTCMENRFLTFC